MTTAYKPRPTPASHGQGLTGRTQPRLWSRPLRRLTPKTSRGYACIAFARHLGIELDPWQQWLLIHALEISKETGGYRFQTVLVLVSRQNGKTTLLKVLTLWRLIEDRNARMAFGTSTNLEYAREAWKATVELAEDRDARVLAEAEERHELAPEPWVEQVKYGAMDTVLMLTNGARYKIGTASRTGGRSLSVDLGASDELREHKTWDAWNAISGTTTARPDPQQWALSNAGDNTSVVLNHLRAQGISHLETGDGDPSLGLFEWSGPDGCALDDRRAWAQANPSLGYRITEATLVSKLGTMTAEGFRTEHLCQNVPTLDLAVDLAAWKAGADPGGTMDDVRSRVACCIDVSPDLAHVSLLAAAELPDGRVRAEVVAAWETAQAARTSTPDRPSLKDWLARVNPRVVGWFPGGPAAALAADIHGLKRTQELKSAEVNAVCMGLAEQIIARRILHPDDPLLTAQISGVSWLPSGDGRRFTRKGAGHCDAVYALAGAVHLARTLPPPPPKPMLISGKTRR